MIIITICFVNAIICTLSIHHQLNSADLHAYTYRIVIAEAFWVFYYLSHITIVIFIASGTTGEVNFVLIFCGILTNLFDWQ